MSVPIHFRSELPRMWFDNRDCDVAQRKLAIGRPIACFRTAFSNFRDRHAGRRHLAACLCQKDCRPGGDTGTKHGNNRYRVTEHNAVRVNTAFYHFMRGEKSCQ